MTLHDVADRGDLVVLGIIGLGTLATMLLSRGSHAHAQEQDEDFESPDCPACGGKASFLGALGPREHWRCRACGIDFSRRSPHLQQR